MMVAQFLLSSWRERKRQSGVMLLSVVSHSDCKGPFVKIIVRGRLCVMWLRFELPVLSLQPYTGCDVGTLFIFPR